MSCFLNLSQNIYRNIQSEGLTGQYQSDIEFGLSLKMLPSLAFVPEQDFVDCFNIIMQDFPASTLNVATYFEDTSIGKRLPDQSKRVPKFRLPQNWYIYVL